MGRGAVSCIVKDTDESFETLCFAVPAFPGGREGTIGIHAMTTDGERIVLRVNDAGVGIPDDVDIRNTETMGMGLVTGLVENQLGGRLELDLSHGTDFTITFTRESARRTS